MTNSSGKPFYKQIWFIIVAIIGGIILLSLIIRISNPKYFEELERKEKVEKDSIANVEKIANEKKNEQAEKEKSPDFIKSQFITKINELKTYLKDDLPNKSNPASQVQFLDDLKSEYYQFDIKYPELKDKKKLLQDFKSIFIKVSVNQFPKIRQNYLNNVENEMWKNNITLTLKGTKKDVLRLVGGIFANNKNKSDMQTTISDIMNKLRFKRVEYLWYEYDDRYTYYNLTSLNDGYFDYK